MNELNNTIQLNIEREVEFEKTNLCMYGWYPQRIRDVTGIVVYSIVVCV